MFKVENRFLKLLNSKIFYEIFSVLDSGRYFDLNYEEFENLIKYANFLNLFKFYVYVYN